MGNHDTKLRRDFASLPPENFPSIRLDRRPSKVEHSRSYDNLDKISASGFKKSQHMIDQFSEDLFLPVYSQQSSVKESDFTILSVIAKGAFGDVLQVEHSKDKSIYAMKVMQKKRLILERAVQQSKDEATIQDAVGYHPLIVKPFWFFQNSFSVFIIMEYIPGGELFTAWKKSGSFNESLIKLYIAELASVLDFLHKSGIIYRDLKMENILLDNRGHLHVTDFGLAKRLKKGQRTNTICGTLQYIAPEVVNAQPYGHSSDWWSLGILVYVLLVGQFPVSGAKNHVEMAAQLKGFRHELPPNYEFTRQIRHLLKQLLQVQPEKRLKDLNSMKQHEFFSGFDFDGVVQMETINNKLQVKSDPVVVDAKHPSRRKSNSSKKLEWKETVASLNELYI